MCVKGRWHLLIKSIGKKSRPRKRRSPGPHICVTFSSLPLFLLYWRLNLGPFTEISPRTASFFILIQALEICPGWAHTWDHPLSASPVVGVTASGFLVCAIGWLVVHFLVTRKSGRGRACMRCAVFLQGGLTRARI